MTIGNAEDEPVSGGDKPASAKGVKQREFARHAFTPSPPRAPGRWTIAGRVAKRGTRTIVLGAAVLAVAAGLFGLVVWMPTWVLSTRGPLSLPDRLAAETQLRTSLVQAMAAVVVLGGLYFTARTVRLNREGHLTDRFAKAVEQLGSENMDVRVGSLHALERIARDSRRDNEAVVAVLVEFVRRHATIADVKPAPHDPELPRDAILAMRILGRRRWANEESARLYFERLCLVGADLHDTDLSQTDFGYSHLDGSIMTGARLNGAFFHSATARGCGLIRTELREAALMGADLTESYLCNADLTGANLNRAILTRVDFGGRFNPDGSMRTAPARLDGAILKDAKLDGAILRGVDLERVKGLTQQQVDEALLDEHTKLPDGLLWNQVVEPQIVD